MGADSVAPALLTCPITHIGPCLGVPGNSGKANTCSPVNEVEGRCPRKLGWRWRCAETGETCPARCGANFCAWCGPVNGRFVAGAIGVAEPERAITLTQVGSTHQERRARMKRLRYCIEHEMGRRVEWAYHVEPNPKETGYHVHAWQRGDFLDQRELSRLADRCGMGSVVWIERMKRLHGTPGINYGLKLMGIEYGLKMVESDQQMGVYLECNGGRLVHTSRGFFVGGQREAMKEYVRKCAAADGAVDVAALTWVLERDAGMDRHSEQEMRGVSERAREVKREYKASTSTETVS